MVSRGEQLMAELEPEALLVTAASTDDPAAPGLEELHMPARAREVFDVTGAGDTVIPPCSPPQSPPAGLAGRGAG